MKSNLVFLVLIIYVFGVIKTSKEEKKLKKENINYTFKRFHENRGLEITEKNNIELFIYNINITELYFHNKNEIDITINYEPSSIKNISLSIIFDINKYNQTGLFWNLETYIVNITLNNNTEKYSTFLDNLNIKELTQINIRKINVISNENINKYNIYYPKEKLYITNETNEYIITLPSFNPYGNSNNEQNIENKTKRSSNKLSSGAIIGIILGIVVFIAIIIFIVICLHKKNKKIKLVNSTNNIMDETPKSVNKINEITTRNIIILEEPTENMRTFLFEMQNQEKIVLIIEKNKNMKDLRQLFFEKINRTDLIEDNSIYFLYNGKSLDFNSKGFIEHYFKDFTILYKIIVVDINSKIIINKN